MKEPQAPVLPQVTVQVTPPLWLSLLTTAVRLAVVPSLMEDGGAGLRATEIEGVVMVMVAGVDDFVGSVTEVAVMVTVPEVGTAAGAV